MNIGENIQRIMGGKSDIRMMARQKNIEIPSSLRIDEYADYFGQKWPDFTFGVTYDGTKIRGKTEKWNQLINGLNVSATSNGITISYNGNGTYILNGTATGTAAFVIENNFTQKSKVGYKYLQTGFSNDTAGILLYVFGGHWYRSENFVYNLTQAAYDDGSKSLQIRVAAGTTLNNVKFRPSIICLTDIFGAGNEPLSVDDERNQKLISYAKDHPQYDVGSLTYAYYKGIKLGEYDYIDTSSNKLHLEGEEVDMGDFNWNYFPGQHYFSSAAIAGTWKMAENPYVEADAICAKYKMVEQSIWSLEIPCICQITTSGRGTVLIGDDNFTDPETLKSSLNGVKLYYRLVTPIEIDLS